ncbi:MAG: N-acetyl-gamma-glutamyl-phosphate reductase [Pseudomonadota bacterium]
MSKIRTAILGASGYTGVELIRLLLGHPQIRIDVLTADRKAGQALAETYPQFIGLDLPALTKTDEVDWATIDLAFCALPHATTQEVIAAIPEHVKIVDLSADFRLRDVDAYARWYGGTHLAPTLQAQAVYGLTEFYREDVAKARLVANPGCYTTTAQLPVVPLLDAGVIDPGSIVIDAKSGISGAGRAPKESSLFAEVSEGFHAYGVGHHRHMAELDQEYSKAAGREVVCSFTPHLVPMNRGILATIYVQGIGGADATAMHAHLAQRFADELFVDVLPFDQVPQTRHVRGTNFVQIGVAADRQPGRAILLCVLDNLVKGASGQAIQNANAMFGLSEQTALEGRAVYP